MAARIGKQYVFGIREIPKSIDLPAGRVRFKMRHNAWLVVFVRNERGTFRYLMEERGETWVPFLTGSNLSVSQV